MKQERVPKVEFRYSSIYDRLIRERWMKEHKSARGYPSPKEVVRYRARLEQAWRKDGLRILRQLARVTGIQWKPSAITCYVVGRERPFSDPMTIPVYRKLPIDFAIDVVTHECIHCLLTQPTVGHRRSRRMIQRLQRRYPKESRVTIIHVIVHAIHELLLTKLFASKRLVRAKRSVQHPDYIRAWEIVDELGAEHIVETFVRRKRR